MIKWKVNKELNGKPLMNVFVTRPVSPAHKGGLKLIKTGLPIGEREGRLYIARVLIREENNDSVVRFKALY